MAPSHCSYPPQIATSPNLDKKPDKSVRPKKAKRQIISMVVFLFQSKFVFLSQTDKRTNKKIKKAKAIKACPFQYKKISVLELSFENQSYFVRFTSYLFANVNKGTKATAKIIGIVLSFFNPSPFSFIVFYLLI